MKPAPFKYLAPDSLSSALEIMGEHGAEAKLLAGGQSLIPAMNFRLVQPAIIVDLNRLTELDYLYESEEGGLVIGAMTRQSQIEYNSQVAEAAPLLHEAMPLVAHSQIRNRGTLGGSLAHADPAAEMPVIMVALDARIRVRNHDAERWIRANECFLGLFTTELEPEDILIEVEIPTMPPRTGWSFVEFARRRGDYALLGVAAVLTVDERGNLGQARLVYLNAGETPLNAMQTAAMLLGHKPSAELFEAVANAAEGEMNLTGNIHASVAYLRNLSRVLTLRALETAYSRALARSL